jgi:ABC-type oligopeptide transport system substrate-binding subunit
MVGGHALHRIVKSGKGTNQMPITPQDFVSKWKRVTAREKQTYLEQVFNKKNALLLGYVL